MVCKDIAPTYISAAKLYPSCRKTLIRLDDLWKDRAKGSANYRLISCLFLIWKLAIGMLAENMYSHLERENVQESEQKVCHKWS